MRKIVDIMKEILGEHETEINFNSIHIQIFKAKAESINIFKHSIENCNHTSEKAYHTIFEIQKALEENENGVLIASSLPILVM